MNAGAAAPAPRPGWFCRCPGGRPAAASWTGMPGPGIAPPCPV